MEGRLRRIWNGQVEEENMSDGLSRKMHVDDQSGLLALISCH